MGHTSIGWHASPRSTTRPFGWTQLGSGLRSMRRHFSVDLTNDMSFWTLWTGSWIFRAAPEKLRTVAQNPQNRRASCLRCLLPSTTRRTRRLGGATPCCIPSLLAGADKKIRSQTLGGGKEKLLARRESPSDAYNTISHQMTAGSHPRGHLGRLNKRAEFGILEHEIGTYDCAIRGVARRRGPVVEARDGLLKRALDAVRADDEIRIEHLSTRERDARPAGDGRVGLHLAHGCAEADAHAGGRAREAVQHRVVVRAVDVVVRRAVVVRHACPPGRVPYADARVVPPEYDRGRLDGARCERGAESPSEQQPRRVGRDLDSRAYVPEFARRLEKRDAVPRVRERVGGGEATETRADDDDVEAEGRALAVVEGWDFLEGYVCDWVCGRVWVVFHDGGGGGGESGEVRGGSGLFEGKRIQLSIPLFPRI